jgi:hypothetical protein
MKVLLLIVTLLASVGLVAAPAGAKEGDKTVSSQSWQDPGGDGYAYCYMRDPFTGTWHWVRC